MRGRPFPGSCCRCVEDNLVAEDEPIAKPIESSQSRLNHFDLPTRNIGAVPHWFGSEPDQVFGLTVSSDPVDSCRRNSSSESGVILEARGAGKSSEAGPPRAGSSVTTRGP